MLSRYDNIFISILFYFLLGETHTLSDGTQYVMAGEVGLLTHNIVIEGSDYAGLNAEGFGGRVLVSSLTAEGVDYQGKGAKERMGQSRG